MNWTTFTILAKWDTGDLSGHVCESLSMRMIAAFACSHAGLMISRRDQAGAAARDRVYAAFRAMGEAIEALSPDAVVIVGTDHGRIYGFEAVPQFLIGVGATASGVGDAGLPERDFAVDQRTARAVLDGLLERDIDIAYSEDVRIDHSFVAPLMLALPDCGLPIVPIVQNCNMPPLPPLGRSHRFGVALGGAIEAAGDGDVALVCTGGLSHWVGSDEYRAFIDRPAGTRLADRAGIALALEDTGPVNEDFDRDFLDSLCGGGSREFAERLDTATLGEVAGNGAQELRNWLVAAGAVGDAPAEVMAYVPVAEWLTGIGLARFEVGNAA